MFIYIVNFGGWGVMELLGVLGGREGYDVGVGSILKVVNLILKLN